MDDHRLADLRILMHDDAGFYKYAKVDLLDQGRGLLIYDYGSQEKLSRHEDGRTFKGQVGKGVPRSSSTHVPFSDIEHEIVREVGIPSDVTYGLDTYRGDPSGHFVFSSTILRASNATFAAEIVDDDRLERVLTKWEQNPDYVSAQTHLPMAPGKSVILTVTNARSS